MPANVRLAQDAMAWSMRGARCGLRHPLLNPTSPSTIIPGVCLPEPPPQKPRVRGGRKNQESPSPVTTNLLRCAPRLDWPRGVWCFGDEGLTYAVMTRRCLREDGPKKQALENKQAMMLLAVSGALSTIALDYITLRGPSRNSKFDRAKCNRAKQAGLSPSGREMIGRRPSALSLIDGLKED